MDVKNPVKVKIRKGVPVFGTWVMMGDLAAAEILARIGYDWVAVDIEHTAIGYETLRTLVCGIQRHGAQPFVRVEENDATVIKRVLDCGATGIIVPQVCSAREAERAARAALYPPEGLRGISISRATEYGANFQDYFRSINDQLVVIVQIEHIRGVEAVEEILAVKGVDGIFVGPYDLSGSMGIVGEFEHPRLKEALDRCARAAKQAKKALGYHVVAPDSAQALQRLEQGFNFIACSTDTLFLHHSATGMLAALRERAEKMYETNGRG